MELDVAGEVAPQWSAIGSLALLDAKTTRDPDYQGNRLWTVARVTASAGAVYDVGEVLANDRLRVGARARYSGRRPGDSANSFWLPSFTVADVFATYDTAIMDRKVRFQFNVKNLTDKTYYTSSVNEYGLALGDARQVSVTASFEF